MITRTLIPATTLFLIALPLCHADEPLFVVNTQYNRDSMIDALKAEGRDAVSRTEYERTNPDRKVVAVTVNKFRGQRPGGGVVVFSNRFVPQWGDATPPDLRGTVIIHWFDGVRPADGEVKRVFTGIGTDAFREELRKVLADQDKLAEITTDRLR